VTESRDDRNEQFFGANGQARIRATSVGIVGLGGLGSPLAAELAYLGIESFGLIDGDRATSSSMNRLFGAGPTDVGKLKVDIARRQIALIRPEARVIAIPGPLESTAAFGALESVDYVFGCLDHDGPRAILVEFCHAFERPLFDLATGVDPETTPMTYGGRVYFMNDAAGCPRCIEPGLDQAEIDLYDKSARDREAEERAYGITKRVLAGGGPSVVSLNCVVASLAVSEFMVHVTGIREAARELRYRADIGVVTKVKSQVRPGCYYCHSVRGTRSAADVGRYVEAARRREA
jgi:molybdopterin/thiamine biosynthesis adenylyltransferase